MRTWSDGPLTCRSPTSWRKPGESVPSKADPDEDTQLASATVVTFTCPCGKKLQVRDEFAGKQGKCPACGNVVSIPRPEETYEPSVLTAEVVEEPPLAEAVGPDEGAPAEITNHDGGPLPQGLDMFVPAPREIGPVMSAYSTLQRGKKPISTEAKVAWMLMLPGFGVLIGALVALATRTPMFALLSLGLGLLGFAI